MFDDLHVEDDVEGLADRGEVLGRRGAVIDGEIEFGGVGGREADGLGGRVDPGDTEAQSRHRLAQQAAAATDVEQPQASEGPPRGVVSSEAGERPVADEGQPRRV